MKVTIRKLTNATPDFYLLLGPFLSRRAIVAETGAPVWDDDGKTWFVALVAGQVAGFCALRPAGDHFAMTSAYVLPALRGQRLYERLWVAREAALPRPCDVRAMCTAAAAGTFLRHGFQPGRITKQYTQMQKTYV